MVVILQTKESNEALVLTKALSRVAEYWGLSNKQLGGVIGLSETTTLRLKNGTHTLKHGSKPWELSLMLLHAYRGLDAYMGGHTENQKCWLTAENDMLGGAPIDLMCNIEGLANIAQYIDYLRGNNDSHESY